MTSSYSLSIKPTCHVERTQGNFLIVVSMMFDLFEYNIIFAMLEKVIIIIISSSSSIIVTFIIIKTEYCYSVS